MIIWELFTYFLSPPPPHPGSDLAEDIERKAHNFLSDVQVKRKPVVQEVKEPEK
jgi:hypothetical protein